MKVITLISFCDLIANGSLLNGVPSDRSLCVTQGILQQFFYPASWLWTVILTYLLFSLVVHGKIFLEERKMHLIVWSICTIITVLPLTTSTYGTHADDDYFCWIQPSGRRDTGGRISSDVWSYFTFDYIIFSCFFLMALWCLLIFHKLKIKNIQTSRVGDSDLNTLKQYPIILFITWFPNAFFLLTFSESSKSQMTWSIVDSLSIWQGGLTAIAFFVNSLESRLLWHHLVFTRCFGCIVKQNETDTLSISSYATFESDDVYYGRDSDRSQSFSKGLNLDVINPVFEDRFDLEAM